MVDASILITFTGKYISGSDHTNRLPLNLKALKTIFAKQTGDLVKETQNTTPYRVYTLMNILPDRKLKKKRILESWLPLVLILIFSLTLIKRIRSEREPGKLKVSYFGSGRMGFWGGQCSCIRAPRIFILYRYLSPNWNCFVCVEVSWRAAGRYRVVQMVKMDTILVEREPWSDDICASNFAAYERPYHPSATPFSNKEFFFFITPFKRGCLQNLYRLLIFLT